MAVPTVLEMNQMLDSYKIRLNEFMGNMIHKSRLRLDSVRNSYILKNPLSLYEIKEQKLDNMIDVLNNFMIKRLENYQLQLNHVKSSYILKEPMKLFASQEEKVLFYEKSLYSNIRNIILKSDHRYKMLVNTLKLVNPLGILEKGYSLVKKEDEIIRSSEQLKVNDKIKLRFHKGNVEAIVESIEN